ncbi:MAG: nicotinate-nucleotide adenylyltransferase [Pseudomonadales bacterium]
MPVPGADTRGIAIFGGTFDPVHFGHLRSAIEIQEALDVSRVMFIPSYSPPHRDAPACLPIHRLEMLRLATRDVPCFEVDDREILREGKSFTIDTLRSLRTELGELAPLSMIVGFDAFRLLDQWREWRALMDYAHLVVLERPGWDESGLPTELANLLNERFVDDPLCLHSEANGRLCRLKLTQMDISASMVRKIFREGRSADYIVPKEVISYVYGHGLYGVA